MWRSGRAPVVLCILFIELCERLTYYSISANLILFCTSQLEIDTATAGRIITLALTGTSCFIPVFGGYIADTIAGKFNTIYGSALIYLVGVAILPAISFDYVAYNLYDFPIGAKKASFGVALFLVAIGTGGMESNLGPFGAQQLEEFGEGAMRSFFIWFYWFIKVGSGVSFSLVVWVQQNVSFLWGFLVPTISILLAIFLLLLQSSKCINRPPEGSALTNIVKVTVSGSCGSGCCCCLKKHDRRRSSLRVQSCFDHTKVSNGGVYPDNDVESTKSILRIMPVFATFIMYWTICTQMSSTYFLQGERLRLEYSNFTFPVAILNIFDIIAILILVPISDRIFYPNLEKMGINFTLLQRIGTGMVLAMCSVIAAAVVEIARKQGMREAYFIEQQLSNQMFNSSNISVFVQIPQFALIGASEVFTSVTGLQFAYSQSPATHQGVLMGLFLLTAGLGRYLGTLLMLLVNSISGANGGTPWLPPEPNNGHLEYFFFLLVELMLGNFLIYLLIAHNYQYARPTGEPRISPNIAALSPISRESSKRGPHIPSKSEVLSEPEM